jgi:hypothetical protein
LGSVYADDFSPLNSMNAVAAFHQELPLMDDP